MTCEIDTGNIEKLKALIPEGEPIPPDSVLRFYLDSAAEIVLNRALPFGGNSKIKEKMLSKYSNIQVRIAMCLLSKSGAEGETAHSENGVSRSYESADVPESLLKQITRGCKIVTK